MSGSGGSLRAAGRVARVAGLAVATLARAALTARPGATAIGDTVRRVLEIHGLEVRASGAPPSGPALLVSNHLSYLDPLVLLSRTPCVPIAKAELASWPVLGAAARWTGALFVERSSAGSRLGVLRASELVLRQGGVVLNFPEGTTTAGSTVLRFRKGLFEVACSLHVPVVPAALRYSPPELAWIGDEAFVPHYLRFARLERCTAELVFGDPIPSQSYVSAELLARAARARILSLLEDSTGWLRKAL